MRHLLLLLCLLSLAAPALAGMPPLPRERLDPAQSQSAPEGEEKSGGEQSTDAPGEPMPEEPARIYQTACPALLGGMVEGRMLPPIAENQCGERSPVEVTAVLVNGRMVPLSSPVTLSCAMTGALPGWLSQVDGYLDSAEDTRLAEIEVSTSYMCRKVNGAEQGRMSEHAFANALDVMGFRLADGRVVRVDSGWPGSVAEGSRMLRHAHSTACALFTTTLGPEANAAHRDHLHVDMGCHGRTCTARLCD